ncbi:DUF3986 family protein [Bacillus wiedmannii]|uniref:DUF3986 family protein n=1 Tax=Bacillus wiedmannii TaxID=1890302 RepID=UPI003F917049
MKIKYNSEHLHLGYYEDGHDIEAIAYKRTDKDIWDIFLDFDHYKISLNRDNYEYKEYDGYKILSLSTHDLDYDYGVLQFTKWLLENKVLHT